MRIKTTGYFKKLIEIIKEDGFLTVLDYDYQITRYRHSFLNWFLEDLEYLKAPCMTSMEGSPARDDFKRVHHSKYYTATYSGAIFRQRLTDLQLK